MTSTYFMNTIFLPAKLGINRDLYAGQMRKSLNHTQSLGHVGKLHARGRILFFLRLESLLNVVVYIINVVEYIDDVVNYINNDVNYRFEKDRKKFPARLSRLIGKGILILHNGFMELKAGNLMPALGRENQKTTAQAVQTSHAKKPAIRSPHVGHAPRKPLVSTL